MSCGEDTTVEIKQPAKKRWCISDVETLDIQGTVIKWLPSEHDD